MQARVGSEKLFCHCCSKQLFINASTRGLLVDFSEEQRENQAASVENNSRLSKKSSVRLNC